MAISTIHSCPLCLVFYCWLWPWVLVSICSLDSLVKKEMAGSGCCLSSWTDCICNGDLMTLFFFEPEYFRVYFVGAVTTTIKCNNEFTGLFHTYRFWTEKICLYQTEFFEFIKVA